jgi:GxxExxY protein
MDDEAHKLNRITETNIGAAIKVHKALGPGLLESVYENCLAFEISRAGLSVQQQIPMPVTYQSISLDCGYRLDLLIDDKVIVEVKAVESILPIHKAQLMTYLRLAQCSVGLLINFNVTVLKDGIVRVVHKFPDNSIQPDHRV